MNTFNEKYNYIASEEFYYEAPTFCVIQIYDSLE